MKLIAISASFLFLSFMHGGHMAEYFLTIENQSIHLKFSIEKDELMHYEINQDCDLVNMTSLCVAKYLKDNMSVFINEELVSFGLEGSFTENDYLIVNFKSVLSFNEVHQISIKNDCFYDFDPQFKNRIILDLGNFNSSYVLNKENKQIDLE